MNCTGEKILALPQNSEQNSIDIAKILPKKLQKTAKMRKKRLFSGCPLKSQKTV